MPEDNQGSVTLEAVLAQENLRAAWLAVEASGGERQPGIPNIRDRLIQQAIHQVLSAESP